MEKIILLIDDDTDELEVFNEALNKVPLFVSCTQVKSAADAMTWLKKNQPDFIFIDFNLPEVDGLQCLEKIKKIKKLANTRCVLYSNHIDEEKSNRAMALGAISCMKKPHMTGLLATRLKDILSGAVTTRSNYNPR